MNECRAEQRVKGVHTVKSVLCVLGGQALAKIRRTTETVQ